MSKNPLEPRQWAEVERMFEQASEMASAEARAAYLDREGPAPEVRAEVESLLAHFGQHELTVASAIESAAAGLAKAAPIQAVDPLIGTRLGPYKIQSLLGRGGMGTVYLASRDDDQFRKQVAIKVIKRGMEASGDVLERFQHERRIMAQLDHPYIARLIDGGVMPDGRPYFEMDYVEGQYIDVYCRSNQLDVRSRLQLFLKVCEAVSYAHRRLVVHRDLKPVNILVSTAAEGGGVPKLLDFGVAKLLADDLSEEQAQTQAGAIGPLTPEYASPEQVRGMPITTATDVYCLGLVLYELLTGVRAQRIATKTPVEIDRVVCLETPPPASSAIADRRTSRAVAGDLDNIVAMALRKEPERRYASVDELAGDINRHLEGLPVAARRGSFRYRAGRFLSRHRLPLAAATLAALGLLVGTALAISQARQANEARLQADAQRQTAERERQTAERERQTAERERGRATSEATAARMEKDLADRRLVQMAELSERLLDDVHASIERIPGTLVARRRIAASTKEFLEKLSGEAGNDERLLAVLATAYRNVGDVQGNPDGPNLGDPAAALADYRKALAVSEKLVAGNPANFQHLLQVLKARNRIGRLLAATSKTTEAEATFAQAFRDGRKLIPMCAHVLECRIEEAFIYGGLARALVGTNLPRSRDYAQTQADLLEGVVREFPQSRDAKLELGEAYVSQGVAASARGDFASAIGLYRRSAALREAAVASQPADSVALRGLMVTYGNLSRALGNPAAADSHNPDESRQYFGKAVDMARELVRLDPQNTQAQYDLANALLFSQLSEPPQAGLAASLEALNESARVFDRLLATNPGWVAVLRQQAWALELAGQRLRSLGGAADSLAAYRRSLAVAERCLTTDPGQVPCLDQARVDEEAIAKSLMASGDPAKALETAAKAVSRVERFVYAARDQSRRDEMVARSYLALAQVQKAAGHCAEASVSAERARVGLAKIRESGNRRISPADLELASGIVKECSGPGQPSSGPPQK